VQVIGGGAQSRAILAVESRVHDLDTVEPERGERAQCIERIVRGGVRQDRQTIGFMQHGDGVANRQPALGYIPGASRQEIALEGVAVILRPAVRDECARNVRPAQRRFTGEREHVVEADVHAGPVETLHDLRGAGAARLAQRRELRAQNIHAFQVQPKDVHFAVVVMGAEFHARDQTHVGCRSGGARFLDAVDGIVIGQGDDGHTLALGRGDQLRR
jgi:hypothetical protein